MTTAKDIITVEKYGCAKCPECGHYMVNMQNLGWYHCNRCSKVYHVDLFKKREVEDEDS